MTLAYDFDIFDVIPDQDKGDPRLDGFLTDIGFKPAAGRTIALFRDPRTAEALRNASPCLRDFFLASGFGLNTYASGAPAGRYPAKDEEARLEIIRRLTENAETHALPRPEDYPEGGDVFRLGAFLVALTRSEPIEMPEISQPAPQSLPDALFGDDETPWAYGLPQVFETDPLPPEAEPEVAAQPRRKFWQSRFFRFGLAAGLVIAVVQLASGPARLVLASL